MTDLATDCAALAAYFTAARPAILAGGRDSVRADPLLESQRRLPRLQLEDHLPEMLETFEQIVAAAFSCKRL